MIKALLLYFFCFSSFAYNEQNLNIAETEVSPHEPEKQCVINLTLACLRYYRLCRGYQKLDVPTCTERFEKCIKNRIIDFQECFK